MSAANPIAEAVGGGAVKQGAASAAGFDVAPMGPVPTASIADTPTLTAPPIWVPHTSKAPPPLRTPWSQEELRQRHPPLQEDLVADVVVVGAGLAGLSTAYRLAKAGKSVVVLESRLVGSGSAGRGLGQISTWANDTYREIERVAGLERARQVAAAHAAAVAFVRQVVSDEGIDCDLTEVEGAVQMDLSPGEPHQQRQQRKGADSGSSSGSSYIRGSEVLREELAACCRAGVEGAHIEFRQRGVLGGGAGWKGGGGKGAEEGFAVEEVLVLPGCLNLHPVKYLRGLAEAVLKHGGRIFEHTRAKGGLVTGPSGGVVKTWQGHIARAREAVVLATHSPINRNQLWVHDRQLPRRDYVVALEVPRGVVPPHYSQLITLGPPASRTFLPARLLPLPTSFLPPPRSRHTIRLAPMPGHHLVAGEGGGGAASSYGDPWARLEHWARTRLPMCGRTLYAWSGSDYYPADMLGLYGRDPLDLSRPPVYIITGHGGQEWTGATLGSGVVSGAVVGGEAEVPWGEAYRPARVFRGATGKYISELGLYFSTVGFALLKHVVPRSLGDVVGLVAPGAVERSIKPGAGRVAQHGLLKKALYRDPEGRLYVRSALCTHLGCCVEWNPLDRTFDCPCHGSQYDACGTCIHGPAVGDLEDLGHRK
ncbi:hypothetical protein VOLCADRAFT_86574 [Volvox carteri f. nagariensis]|uniref:Rieske domain-containing protein n=1 Tax=Volvox carteri f. nagariensis TaxID=3068 RepID=D8TJ13_VOLCA|nr:uncharacterized protein VOLCADRAFT_86574 [Volvox carteri f. nagariensis]EFJ52294.1 hypothetical protein VOLCADRAFT_86574 [Volvox carteri f. nagariensis]|eukprot:XP_002946367.1 hypothetical protein VOLCADRAFT_86574 [Volvox carteri f. nagariensis]